MGKGGCFGRWAEDEWGLPCLDVECSLHEREDLVLPRGGAGRIWHQVGNDRITATAHAGGWTTLYAAERGLVRLNGTDPDVAGRLGGTWSVRSVEGRELLSTFATDSRPCARWGTGYARWVMKAAGLEMCRRVWAPFGDVPALRIDMELTDTTGDGLPAGFLLERWGIYPYPIVLGLLMSRTVDPPVVYPFSLKVLWHMLFAVSSVSRTLTDMLRRLLGRRMALPGAFDPRLGAVVVTPRPGARSSPSVLSRLSGSVFVAALSDREVRGGAEAGEGGTTTHLEVPMDSGEERQLFSFAVGIAPEGEISGVLERVRQAESGESASAWGDVAHLTVPEAPALEREASWHAYYLRGAQVRDGFFDCRYVPQGSAYGYIQGGQGAPRDYAITSVPLTYLDPAGGRDLIRLMMRMTRPDGSFCYAHTGDGACMSAVMHADPTDLPLFFLWAITEHVWATGGKSFLDERVPFYSRRPGTASSSTVRERVLLAWRYTRDVTGLGPHRMLRVGSGDWMDPISLMVPDRRAFHRRGESAFNTALAVYVLPRAADLVEDTDPGEAASMRSFADELRSVMEDSWRGRWFLRGWDGAGGPVGEENLFLDAQVWCLIARIGSREQRDTLVRAIEELCDGPSPIGATILDRPRHVRLGLLPPGWDCNGGVWAAINGMLAWAYALHDPDLAWRCLAGQSLDAHARAYPRVWYGIWSGPDAYNAHYAGNPGETFTHPSTPMAEFPVMNSNAHAGPLLGLLKVLGVEASPDGIAVTPRLPEDVGPWRLTTTLLDVESDGGSSPKITTP